MRTLHVGVKVTDLDRSVAFYAALGYEVVGEVPATELGRLTMLKLPDDEFVSLELVHNPSSGSVSRGALSHLVINVASAEEIVGRLAAQGIVAEAPQSPDGSEGFWTTWLTDPDGVRIELVQWPDGHPQGMTQSDLSRST